MATVSRPRSKDRKTARTPVRKSSKSRTATVKRCRTTVSKKTIKTEEPRIIHADRVADGEPFYVVYLLNEHGRESDAVAAGDKSDAKWKVESLRLEGKPAVARKIERFELSNELMDESMIEKEIKETIERDRKYARDHQPRFRKMYQRDLADKLDGLAITKLRMKIIKRYQAK